MHLHAALAMNQRQQMVVDIKGVDEVACKYPVPNMHHEVYSYALRIFSGSIPHPVDSVQDMDDRHKGLIALIFTS